MFAKQLNRKGIRVFPPTGNNVIHSYDDESKNKRGTKRSIIIVVIYR